MSFPFWPDRVFFEPAALQFALGKQLYSFFEQRGVPVAMTSSHNRVAGIPGKTAAEVFMAAKRTLVVGLRRSLSFQTCRPSAHYQLPLATGCPGRCQYCYLHTTLGKKPYLRAYVNVEEILRRAGEYINKRAPEITSFEGSAVSDPLFVEPFTGAVSEAILFFAAGRYGRLRLATKCIDVDPFLSLPHRGHTHVRFSINTPAVIERFEEGTPVLAGRLQAAYRMLEAGYPTGFLIAPIFLENDWRRAYGELLKLIRSVFPAEVPISFELITHRFTARAKKNIADVFPSSDLDLDVSSRQFKFGQFGYGKYLYSRDKLAECRSFLEEAIAGYFPAADVEYFV